MAGVAQGLTDHVDAGMFSGLARIQYAALARMRWSMFRNGMRSSKGAFELGARVGMMVLYAVMGMGMAFGLGAGAFAITSHGDWKFLPLLFWVVCFLWQIVPISMASFQQQFDPGGLLRFPVSFGAYYLLHLIFGLIDASTIMGGFCCMGLLVGIGAARPDLIGWTLLALAVFAAFNVFLVRAIFAWIDRWLAQRRTREILTGLFFVAILGMQLLNPALRMNTRLEKMGPEARSEAMRWVHRANEVQQWLPPGLAAGMVRRAQEEQPVQSIEALCVLGIFVFATSGVLAARLRAEYRGENLGEAPARKETERRRGEWLIDGSGPVAAVIEKELRTLLRAMPLLYALGAPVLMVFVFTSMSMRQSNHTHHNGIQFHFPMMLLLCLAYGIVGFTQMLYNNLGAEGAGIQVLFLSPTPIRTVILAKNLFHSGLFALEALFICAIVVWRTGMPAPDAFAAILCWLLFAVPTHLAAGDVLSITMPYRINLGRIGRQRGSQANALLSLLIQAGVLGTGAGVLGFCSLFDRLWLAVPIFLVMAAIAIFAWQRVLANVDRLANRRREDLVSELVRAE